MQRSADAPFWRVFNGVLSDIRTGVYPPGGRVPSESALAEMYEVSRSTVTRAMERLRWIGLVSGPAGGIGRVAPEPRRSRALELVSEADRLRAEADGDSGR
ncbi:winged helix-turn-helix domain-containing protein [Dactylosporangium sp. CA-139066]|uniref:winged helix-turn-helix domain-containing protein n=1 Tax=Dactylosporangium sp. CA-139066 TaxID=3239930 RepID=UPI003D9086D5